MLAKIKSEYSRIFSDRVYLTTVFFAPIISLIILGGIYEQEILRELPVSIVDNDNSTLSRKLAFYIDSSPSFKIENGCSSLDEAEELLKRGEIEACFVIPKDTEKNVKTGKLASVTVLKNSKNIVTGNVILKDATTIIRTVSGGITVKKLLTAGNNKERATALANPIDVIANPLYNPNYSYEKFLVPAIALFFIQMSLMLAGVMAFNKKRFGVVRTSSDYFVKVVTHLSITSVFQSAGFLLVLPFFNVSYSGCTLQLILLFVIFSCASFFPGAAVSLFVEDLQSATEYVMFFNTPAFIFSGLTFPIWSMPILHRIISEFIPLTHFLEIFIRVGFMNLEPAYYWPGVLKLFLFILVSVTLMTFRLYRQTRGKEVPSHV